MSKKGNHLFIVLLFFSIVGASLNFFSIQGYSWEIDETGTVYNIVDGDTIDVTSVGRIRLADIDCPEPGEPGGDAASQYLSDLIYQEEVYVDVDDVYGTDIYGRVVAVIYVDHNATHVKNVNKALLVAGHAVIDNYDNEFNPHDWNLYETFPSSPPNPPPNPPPPDPSPDDPDPSGTPPNYSSVYVGVGITVGIASIIGSVYAVNHLKKVKMQHGASKKKGMKVTSKIPQKVQKPTPLIKNITAGKYHISLCGKVTKVNEVREFTRKDGSRGQVGSFVISDSSGSVRVVVWDGKCSILNQIHPGKDILITDCYSKINDYYKVGEIEIHVGKYSHLV